ncbi:hypothetical protein BAE46_07310 [Glaciecola punicea]|nr:hypothetical protein BAE46_07310 [Glaciecola punicea]
MRFSDFFMPAIANIYCQYFSCILCEYCKFVSVFNTNKDIKICFLCALAKFCSLCFASYLALFAAHTFEWVNTKLNL